MPPRILFIRHAESEWNARGLWQGWGDPPLSARGVSQAEALAMQLEAHGRIDALVTSSLARAVQTAEAVAARLGIEVRPDPRLRELGVGSWEGRLRRDIELGDARGLAHFDTGDPHARAGGGETMMELAARARPALAEHLAEVGEGRLALVLHLGVLRTLAPGRGDPANAGYFEVGPEAVELNPAAPLARIPHGKPR
jgi:probable phosphoglycerate mutase